MPTPQLQQLEADEEFARQLAQEDEAAAAEQRRRREAARSQQASTPEYATPGGGGEGLSRPLSYQPYVPKSRRNTANPGMSALSPTISPSSTSWEPPARAAQAQDRSAETQTRDELAEIGEQMCVTLFDVLFSRPWSIWLVLSPSLDLQHPCAAPSLRNKARGHSRVCSARSRRESQRWTMRLFALRAFPILIPPLEARKT